MKWFLGIFAVVSLSAWGILEFVFPLPKGHWHLVMDYERKTGKFESLDFEGQQATVGSIIYEFGGTVDRFQKIIRFWPGCMSFEPHYYFNGDSLNLDEGNQRHFALKFNKSECTKQIHFFSNSHLIIDLVEINDTLSLSRIEKLGFINGIEISEERKDTLTEGKIYPYGGDLEVNPKNLSLHIERHKITVPERHHDKIQLALYADKKTKVKHLKPILQKLAEITDRPKVVLVFQYNPQPDDFELFGKEVLFEGVDWTEVKDELLLADYVLGQN